MSIPGRPKPAKLVIGLFMKETELLAPLAHMLTEYFGPIDMVSPWLSFDFTSYYHREMGHPLIRRVFTFQKLIEQNQLPNVKLATNSLEREFTRGESRRVNIDPGYMLLERFVLATGKNFTHRIYLDKGIYADLTLIYQKGAFRVLPWTYPDYAHEDMLSYLNLVRKKYTIDLKREEKNNDSKHDSLRNLH